MAILEDILGLGQPGASDPLTGIAMILQDVFGGEMPSPQPGPGADRMTPPSLLPAIVQPGQHMIPGDLQTSNIGEVGSPGPTPQPRAMPRQRAPEPVEEGPDMMDRFGAFLRETNRGGLLAGLDAAFTGVDRNQQMAKGTYAALIQRGMEPNLAKMVVSDPDTMRKVIPMMFTESFNPPKPDIINVKTQDQFGNTVENPMVWNPRTRKLEPASSLMGGQPSAAPSQAAPAPSLAAPAEQPQSAPALVPPQFMLPGNLATQNIGEVGASGIPQPGPQSAPQAGASQSQPPSLLDALPQPQTQNLGSQRYIVGPAAPKERLGEGNVQQLDAQGRPLWQPVNGKLEPVRVNKTQFEERGKADATAEADTLKKQKAAEGVAKLVSDIQGVGDKYGKVAAERAMGPWQAPAAGEGTVAGIPSAVLNFLPQQAARGWAELGKFRDGGAAPTEVRDDIVQKLRGISTITKPFVRGAGEGVWTDADQRNLDELVGNAARSRDLDELMRRTNETVQLFENAFGVKVPEIAPRARQATDPVPAEDETSWWEGWRKRNFGY